MATPLIRNAALKVPAIRRLYEAWQRSEAHRAALENERDGLRGTLGSLQRDIDKLRGDLERVSSALGKASELPILPPLPVGVPRLERAEHWAYLKNLNQLVELDFPVVPKVRYGHGAAPDPLISKLLAGGHDRYAALLDRMLPLLEPMRTIPAHPVEDQSEPNWQNLAFPALDAMVLYGLIALRRPRRFLEIGSGFSTKFARRAIRDHGLTTRIVSIDPAPRAEVDAICDEVIRKPLEEVEPSFFEPFGSDDLIFFDGSHRAFQNSDVTVFFTEILPRLGEGTMWGIHDTFLPDDYPPAWLDWYFNEQYMLACWLLAGDRIQVELPAHYIGKVPELVDRFKRLWEAPNLAGANLAGGCFFAVVRSTGASGLPRVPG